MKIKKQIILSYLFIFFFHFLFLFSFYYNFLKENNTLKSLYILYLNNTNDTKKSNNEII